MVSGYSLILKELLKAHIFLTILFIEHFQESLVSPHANLINFG